MEFSLAFPMEFIIALRFRIDVKSFIGYLRAFEDLMRV